MKIISVGPNQDWITNEQVINLGHSKSGTRFVFRGIDTSQSFNALQQFGLLLLQLSLDGRLQVSQHKYYSMFNELHVVVNTELDDDILMITLGLTQD